MSRARRWKSFELPLLAKELNEQAARRRTYVIRFLYAGLLFTAACGLFYGNFIGGGSGGGLGQGRLMFERLVTLQFWSIYLFLPALSCGCLTIEKERNCLGLLLLTSLSPWQIVFEKLLGRVVPMVTFVLLSFPLMAVAYSFGGVTEDYLWSGVLLLLVTCFETGALSVACSAYYPTTVESFVGNYVLFVAFRYLLPFGWGPFWFERAEEAPFSASVMGALCLAAFAGVFLVAARLFVQSRAFVSPKNVLLAMFKRLDAYFTELNQVTGGIILVKDGDPLPGRDPIAWRETAKKSLGTFRYLFRVLVALELPLLAVCISMQNTAPGGPDLSKVSRLLYGLWVLGGAMIIVHAGSVISSERTRQTLDVLLAVPLSGREIVEQKMSGVWRLIRVLLVPFLTIFVFELWWNQGGAYWWGYALLSLGSLVYLPLLAWFALWMGLRFRSQTRSVLSTMAAVGLWLAMPTVVRHTLTDLIGVGVPSWLELVLLVNPAALVPAIERLGSIMVVSRSSVTGAMETTPETLDLWLRIITWFAFGMSLALNAWLLARLKRRCLAKADLLLGRLEEMPAVSGMTEPETIPLTAQQMAT